jgi:hypothetical protein
MKPNSWLGEDFAQHRAAEVAAGLNQNGLRI